MSIGDRVIGPAEIEEMMAELAETVRSAGAGEGPEQDWPVFVRDAHLDKADEHLIGSYRRWVASGLLGP